ncbi:MAG: hypothetical protein WA431_05425 [Candidatus Cybelea sp.]
MQNRVVELLTRAYPSARVVDRRANPAHGYRAVHVIVQESGHYIEVQVRTHLQNGWAQLSEKYSDLYDQRIKYGGGPRPFLEILIRLSNSGKGLEDLEVSLDDFRRTEINTLFRKKRSGGMMVSERARLNAYQQLLLEKRQAKAAMLQLFKDQAKP